jgi:hypothetical protein
MASAGVAAAPAPSGGCLTKRDLPDGSALCTHEQAESQPQGNAPGAR